MSFTEQVERGRELVADLSNAKWELGDLALEIMPAGVATSGPERADLQVFADAIDLDAGKLLEYRRVAMTFPKPTGISKGRRDDVSWGVHLEMVTVDNPLKVLHQRRAWTRKALREYRGFAPTSPRRRVRPILVRSGSLSRARC